MYIYIVDKCEHNCLIIIIKKYCLYELNIMHIYALQMIKFTGIWKCLKQIHVVMIFIWLYSFTTNVKLENVILYICIVYSFQVTGMHEHLKNKKARFIFEFQLLLYLMCRSLH